MNSETNGEVNSEVNTQSSSQKTTEKEEMQVASMRVGELKMQLAKMGLSTKGRKSELRERLERALDNDGKGDSDSSNDEDEDSGSSEDEVPSRQRQLLSFKDVEESVQTFSGDDATNINSWLKEFEELAELCEWSDIQKIIYCKRLLRGSAKLFVHYEKCAKTWKRLKATLKAEFSETVCTHKIHRILTKRTKKSDETYQEYVYKMCDIAAQASIETTSVIQYIIDGIQDEVVNKTILYGANTIHELKKKLAIYETMRESARSKVKYSCDKERKDRTRDQPSTGTSSNQRCYNCGARSHRSAECPSKAKGARCFSCNEFGHISKNCKKNSTRQGTTMESCHTISGISEKCCMSVKLCDGEAKALIDTGSDLSLIKADRYFKIGAPRLGKRIFKFRGIGSSEISTHGEIDTTVTISDNTYPITLHVVSDTLLQYDLLLGIDFLKRVDISIKNGEISILKPKSEPETRKELPEIFKIDTVRESDEISEIDLSHIENSKHREKIESLVRDYKPCKIRDANLEMNLVLKDDEPVFSRPRRLSPAEKGEVDAEINKWLADGIIQPSFSDYASPVVLVRKKNGSGRLCIDYRRLNEKIVKDRYPLPLIEDQLDALQGARVFSTIDLKNGFFHVTVNEKSRKYTAFVVPNGHYEFRKVPFGLCNSPSVFQKFINFVFKELIASGTVLTYMDDLIVPSDNMERGIDKLEVTLKTASDFGLIINWGKCQFLKTRVEYLGHIVENGRVQPSAAKTTAVAKFPKPTNIKSVQSFLGLTGYFRKFVPQYSTIAKPLSDLLKKGVEFSFSEKEQDAFERLKAILCNGPILKLYKVNVETELHTDASCIGYGAILMQRDNVDGLFHPIYYASGKTTPAEEKYPSYELEVLAIIKSLRKFRVYLLGIEFKIVTDCRAFALTMRKKDLCVRVARWALLLEEFRYTIEHRAGKTMAHADALSRNPLPEVMLIQKRESGIIARLKKAQHEDKQVRLVIDKLNESPIDSYVMRNDILYKEANGDVFVVVPKALQTQVVRHAHEQGHFAIDKTLEIVKKDYWFEGMRNVVIKVVQNCVSCILAEKKNGKPEGWLHTIDKGEVPLHTFHIDHLGPIPSTKKNYRFIFVVVDGFSKFVWLYATKSTDTAEVLRHLRKQATVFGSPRRIISDRGTAFTSRLFAEYCQEEHILHLTITTGMPRGNGQAERVNRTLIPLLTKMSSPKPEEWYRFLDTAQQYLNATPTRSTGMAPFNLLFGTRMRLRENQSIRDMIEEEWRQMFQEDRDECRKLAKESILRIQAENRKTFNKRRRIATQYEVGDLVAIRRTQFGPGLKLYPKYMGPYEITRVLRNDRYVVKKVGEHEGPFTTSTAADSMKPWKQDDTEDLEEDCVD